VPEEVTEHVKRRLAAILFAGYSRLLPGDEASNFASVTHLLSEIIRPQVRKSGGNIIRWTGDGTLIEFDSIIEAVRCAAALREAVSQSNQMLMPEQRVGVRMGINLDDIIAEDGDVFGDGVNIAARLEALAELGSVYVSEIVRDRVAGKLRFDFEDLGPHSLKNIAKPVRIFRLGGEVAEQSASLANGGGVAASPTAFENCRAVAVLPFANFGSDPEQEYFAEGITEDIISMLAGWRAFPVIARDSTFTYKGQTVDIKKVGQELGVRYVVEGSVRKSGRRIRVTAQLIQADTGHHLMAERYDRDLIDSFVLQDEIVSAIAGAIRPELLKFERERIANRPQHNGDAYEFYQRGIWHHYRHNKEDNIEAQGYFRRALAIDPHYPQATAALSIAIRSAAYLGWVENVEQNYEESFELGQRAVALDARYPNAHFALGLACMYTHRPDRAMAELRQAIDLNPSFAEAYAILGHTLTYAGRPEETIPLVERGIRLSPTDPRLFIWLPALAAAHYQLSHYQQAVEIGRRSWTLNRNRPVGLRYVVAGLAQLGKIAEAQAALTELYRFDIDLASFERLARRLFKDRDPVDRILDGLRKAGMK
jgi:TolB-like protein/class 3 adenylate cyclase/Tfp pilus assembly protein PilF